MSRPIGIFDSGIGGLTVLREIHRLLPHEPLVYLADTANIPYGSKPEEWIRERSVAIADALIEQHAIKALVVACNTATAAAAPALRSRLAIPVIGMEPAVKPAASATRNGTIGILATEGTIRSARLAGLLKSFADGLKVVTQPCTGLVEQIEREGPDSPGIRQQIRHFTQPLLHHGADTIVLGCTHYPLVAPLIREIVGPDISLIDTAAAVARQTMHQLQRHGLLDAAAAESITLLSSGPADRLADQLSRLFPELAVLPVAPFPNP